MSIVEYYQVEYWSCEQSRWVLVYGEFDLEGAQKEAARRSGHGCESRVLKVESTVTEVKRFKASGEAAC